MAEIESLSKIQEEFSEYVEAATELETENRRLNGVLTDMKARAAGVEVNRKTKFAAAKRDWRKQTLEYSDKRERKLRETLDETLAELLKSQSELMKYKAFFEEETTKNATLVMLDYNRNDKHVAILNVSQGAINLEGLTVRFTDECNFSFAHGVLQGGESLSLWWGSENEYMAADLEPDSYYYGIDPPNLGCKVILLKGGEIVATCRDSSSSNSSSSSSSSRSSSEDKRRGRDDMESEEGSTSKKRRMDVDIENSSNSIVTQARKKQADTEHIREICRGFIFDTLRKRPSLRLQQVTISPTEVVLAFDNRGSKPVEVDSTWKVLLLSPSQAPVSCPCTLFTVPSGSCLKMTVALPSGAGRVKFTHVALQDGRQLCRSATDSITVIGKSLAQESANGSCTIC